ncbi:MAG: biopolymer transporter ExbD [Thermoanaerobaculia bacterium]|nr:biopolymer transporter ExbD [Thermoanaerobaculia bacterium]MBP9822671.1 biopolymer transporter ExbD [Thermoanaerobaculia bacterium]
MSMDVGSSGGIKSEINVTPLVDVVLVLLIIFMVIQPMLQMGYEVETPPEVKSATPPPQNSEQVIIRMDADGKTFINKLEVPRTQFAERLRTAMTGREKKLAFFAADGELSYEKVVEFMDLCRNNGAQNLGIVFDDLRPQT